uniref:BPI1 domain-containing protein n=1 Tax=Loa loa TaxID=7209 RepID=A0A1I7VRR8_LOALO
MLGGDKIELKLKQNCFFVTGFFIFFDKTEGFQLHLQLVDSSAWTLLDGKIRTHFISKLKRRVASLVSNQLMIPLPTVQDIVAHNGVITFQNNYILHVSFLSQRFEISLIFNFSLSSNT